MARAKTSKAKKTGEEQDIRGESGLVGPPAREYETAEDVAAGIAAQCDLVAVGVDLLKKGGEAKGASVKLRMWESVMRWLYGGEQVVDAEPESETAWSWGSAKREPAPGSDAT